jgi:archaellum biogenesis ATPase FlaH
VNVDVEKQRLILSLIAGNRDLMALTSGIMRPSYFDPAMKKTVKFMLDYFEEYRDVPKLATIRAEVGTVLEDTGPINRADATYVANEVEEFCRNRAVTEAILQGPDLLSKGDFGKIISTLKDAISVGLQKDMGIDYFENPEERLRKTLVQEAKISTGWPELDAMIGGGVGRQELILFAANSGVGKSMTMLNLARNFLAQGLNGVYISLEMSEGVVSKRLDSMISKISQDNLLKEMSKVAAEVERAAGTMGKFIIKRMAENRTNVNDVRSWLQQLEQSKGFRPDFIVIDYIDIMGTTHTIASDNLFVKDKFVTEEVRSLGLDFDAIMISASQLGRGAIDADKVSQAHIQGGISKINTADYAIALKQDDLMRAAGEISFELLKARNANGVVRHSIMRWDAISLLITSLNKGKPGLPFKPKKSVVLDTDGTLFSGKTSDKPAGVLGLLET